jgi:hypothetical protein
MGIGNRMNRIFGMKALDSLNVTFARHNQLLPVPDCGREIEKYDLMNVCPCLFQMNGLWLIS